MDAITLLRNDHKTVETLFKRFEKAGDQAYTQKRAIVERIIEELSIHAAIEEQVFYPVTRAAVPATREIALESLEEHHIVKWVLSELEDLDPKSERFNAKVTVLIENVRHHVEEEQTVYFPKVRDAMTRAELNDLGKALMDAKRIAPTHPHPRSADAPPENYVMSAISGVVDRVTDNISGIAQGGVSAGQDLIARIVGTKKPLPSPTGSTVARKTAAATRSTIDTAVNGTAQTARSVQNGATATITSVKSGAKGTMTSARHAVGKTATTAKRATTTTARTAQAAAANAGTTAKSAASKTAAAARR